MDKSISFTLLFFFTCSLFVATFNPVLAELVEGSWNTKTPMHQGRMELGAISVDGKIYAIGGYADTIGVVGTNEQYDPVTDTWTTLTSMPTPRNAFAIVAYQNKIYCIGGYTMVPLSVNEVYDITTDSWSTKTPLPVSDFFIQAHVVDEKIFVVTQQDMYVYDPVNDSWIIKTSMPTQGIHAFSAIVDNKIIIIDQVAHYTYPEYSTVRVIATMKVMIYDPKTDAWSEGQTSPEYTSWDTDLMRSIVAGTTTGQYAPKKIYTLFSNSSHVYNPVENTWTSITAPPISVIGYGVAVVDDILYAFGGIHYPHVENMQYVPIGHKNAVPSPESANPTTTLPITPESTNTSMSEPPVDHEPNLTYIIVLAFAVTIVTFTMVYFVISKKRRLNAEGYGLMAMKRRVRPILI